MSEPWFDANQWGWLPGTALGVLGGLWGALAGTLAPHGRGKALVWGTYWVLLAAGGLLLAAGVVAVAGGQPYGVWYGLLLPGVLVLAVVAPLGVVARNRFRMAEERRMRAQDLG